MLIHDMSNIGVSNYVQVKGQPGISWRKSKECDLYFCARRIACAKHHTSNCSFSLKEQVVKHLEQ